MAHDFSDGDTSDIGDAAHLQLGHHVLAVGVTVLTLTLPQAQGTQPDIDLSEGVMLPLVGVAIIQDARAFDEPAHRGRADTDAIGAPFGHWAFDRDHFAEPQGKLGAVGSNDVELVDDRWPVSRESGMSRHQKVNHNVDRWSAVRCRHPAHELKLVPVLVLTRATSALASASDPPILSAPSRSAWK